LTQIKPGTTLTQEQKKEYEAIDGLRVMAMQMAEQKCHKLQMGNIKWSQNWQ